jgi:hypothetical protein
MEKIFCIQLLNETGVLMVNHEQIEKIIKPDGNDFFIDFIFPSITLRYREMKDNLNNLLNSVTLLLKTLRNQHECLSLSFVNLESSSTEYRNYLNHLLLNDLNDLKIYQQEKQQHPWKLKEDDSSDLIKSIFSNKFPKEQELKKLKEKLIEIQKQNESKVMMDSLPLK